MKKITTLNTGLCGCGDRFDVDSIESYANYGFHEVEQTPLIKLSFDDVKTMDGSLENDGSVSGNVEISAASGAELTSGRFGLGQALNLTSADTYLSTPDLGELDALTISLWLNIKDLQTRDNTEEARVTTLLDTKTGTGRVTLKLVHTGVPPKMMEGTNEVDQGNNNTKLVFSVEGNTGGTYEEDGVSAMNERFYQYEYTFSEKAENWICHLPDHCWFHLAVVYNPDTNQVTFYESGKFDSVHTFRSSVKPVLDGVRIGAGYAADQYLEGMIDDVQIYDVALSAEDIEALADFERDMWAYRTAGDWEESTAILYVDGENGDDSNSGTKEEPFSTIKKGVESITKEGTRLVIAPGTYREGRIDLNASGTELQPIIMEAEKPGETIISGSSILSDWEMTEIENVYCHEWKKKLPDGSSMAGNEFAYRTDMIYMDGKPTEPVFSKADLKLNSYYLDKENEKIYLMTKKLLGEFVAEIPDIGYDFEHEQAAYLFNGNSKEYLVLRGLTFTNTGTSIFGSAVTMGLAKHILIEDCAFHNSNGNGLGFACGFSATTAEDILIRRCAFDNNGSGAFGAGFRTMNLVIENCEFTDMDWKIEWSGYDSPDPACMKFMITKNVIVRNCRFDHNYCHDMWFDNSNWNIDMNGNCSTNNRCNNSIHPEINYPSVQIRNNALEGGLHFGNVEGTIIDNNIIWGEKDALFTHWGFEVRYDGNNKNKINQGGPGLAWNNTILTNNYFYYGRENSTMFMLPPYESFYDMYASGNKFYMEGGKSTDLVARSMHDLLVDINTFVEQIGDKSAEYLTQNPFLDDGTATISFKDEASVSLGKGMANYIPVVVSKPLMKEVSVSYTVYDFDSGEVMKDGVLKFDRFTRQKDIYIGDDNRNILIELHDAKDILLGKYTSHYQTKIE